MKRHLTVLLCSLLLLSNAATGQVTVQIGTGTSVPGATLFGPVYRFSATSTTTCSRSNFVYTQAEMAGASIPAGATITSVEFNKTNAANFVTPANHMMYMANTSNTVLSTSLTWASVLLSHTLVYTNAAFNMPLAAGWVSWTVTPFVYTGGALEIATECTMGGNGAATDKFVWEYTSTVPTDQLVGAMGTTLPATLTSSPTTYKFRPNIKITYLPPGGGCTSPPTPGTATASVASLCAGGSVNLDLTGNSTGSTQTYQWQSSPTASGSYTNVGGSLTSPATTVTPGSSLFYRCAVTCGSSTMNSAPVQVLAYSPLNGTYTIDKNAPASATNFQSFTAAVNAMACGIAGNVVLNVVAGSGPYNEQVTIPALSTSAMKTITINGNGNTLTYSSANSSERAGIKLNGADYITINNLVIAPTGTYGYAIQMLNDADNNTINGCTINNNTTSTDTLYAGIVASGSATSATSTGSNCDNIVIKNNTINGGYYGISLMGNATTTRLNNCEIKDNVIKDFFYYGINTNSHSNLTVEGNEITRPTRTIISDFQGIVFTYVTGSRISKNKLHNSNGGSAATANTCYPIYFTNSDATPGSENIVSNNLIYNINTPTGAIYGIYNDGSDYARYYYNTVVLDNAASASGDTRGFFQTTSATGIEFKNNLIYITRGGTTDKFGIYKGTPGSAIVANNNAYYVQSAVTSTNYVGYSGAAQASLLNWQGASGQDAYATVLNPAFASIAMGNFMPTTVAFKALGTPIAGITTDIYNAPRSATTPDIGAIEVCIAAAVITTHPALAGNVCSGTNTVLSVTATNAVSYQWQVNMGSGFVNVDDIGIYSGSTTNALLFSGVPASYNGYEYRVVVTGGCGAPATSNMVPFMVIPSVVITSHTLEDTVCEGSNVSLEVVATGTVSFYQWQVRTPGNPFTDVPASAPFTGSNSAILQISGTPISLLYSEFRCVLEGCNTEMTAPMPLAVLTAPMVLLSPRNDTVAQGASATFTVQANDYTSYQWQASSSDGLMYSNIKNNILYSGYLTNTLTILNSEAKNRWMFRCVVTSDLDECGFANDTSDAAMLVIVNPTGVANVTDQQVNIYPNPVADGHLFVSTPLFLTENVQYKIVDKVGRVLLEGVPGKLGDKRFVDVGELTPDIYYLQLYADKSVIATSKFVKE